MDNKDLKIQALLESIKVKEESIADLRVALTRMSEQCDQLRKEVENQIVLPQESIDPAEIVEAD